MSEPESKKLEEAREKMNRGEILPDAFAEMAFEEIARLKLALSGRTFYEKPCESCGGPTRLPKFEVLP